ncbi:MAG TPA: hypothetical protein VK636_13490 [Gemmatimonadaceae bacterium]|nr:hypothetical protein [Gemmatimonadaceae bacterium]
MTAINVWKPAIVLGAAALAYIGLVGPKASTRRGDELPRLTANAAGVYGEAFWAPAGTTPAPGSAEERDAGLTFQIRNVFIRAPVEADPATNPSINQDISDVVAEIKNGLAYDPVKRTLVRIDFWECTNPPACDTTVRVSGPHQSADFYWARMQKVMKQLEPVVPRLIGVSLSEENEPNGGRPTVLDSLYGLVKEKYPDLAVY